MLKPLKQFYCDTCGQIIENPEEGWIEWLSDYDKGTKKRSSHSFKIVHHYSASPLATETNDGCYQHSHKSGRSDNHLHQFLSEDYKMANILKFLDIGEYHDPSYSGTQISDMREYVEVVRRLTIPYYEEARMYWSDALADGYFADANEIWIYGSKNLKGLIENYGDK